MLDVRPGRPIRGRVRVPGDKSVSHRALLFGSIAQGVTRIRGLLESEDTRATARAVAQLGRRVWREQGDVFVQGGPWRDADETIDCGNSGTTARLVLGALAGRATATLDGDASLRRRPMARVTRPLAAMGADVDAAPTLPLRVRRAALRGVDWRAEVASAQVKSALLLAGLHAEGPTVYHEPIATRDHTERMLTAMGATIEAVDGRVTLWPGPLRALDVTVPGDISSAAFWMVAASIVAGSDLVLENVGLNPTRTGVIDVLREMGADLEVHAYDGGAEPAGDVRVRAAPLRGVIVSGARIPRLIDEIPVLAVAAAFASGTTEVRDAAELRVKESDRVAATVAGLRALGCAADARPDGMIIEGGGALHAGEVASEGDHRIAMAFAVAGARVGARIRDPDNIATSYPDFVATLERLRA